MVTQFLIHRVELKGLFVVGYHSIYISVSNSPCGVESEGGGQKEGRKEDVSNSPCGVESQFCHCFFQQLNNVSNSPCGVERKSLSFLVFSQVFLVSNSPCGVESHKVETQTTLCLLQFLIHRVELKAFP